MAVNPYCACGHMVKNHGSLYGPCAVSGCDCKLFNNPQNPLQPEVKESNLVLHARSELATLGNEPAFNNSIVEMVKIFSSQGHSGTSAMYAVDILFRLLNHRALSELTDNPDEWHYHGAEVWGVEGGIWQNKRDPKAFSNDHGITFWTVDSRKKRVERTKRTPEGEIATRDRLLAYKVTQPSTQVVPNN